MRTRTTVLNTRSSVLFAGFILLLLLLLSRCSGPSAESTPNEVIVWELNEPSSLNPLTANDLAAQLLLNYTHQKLLNYDYDTYELIPVLAANRPEITLLGDTAMQLAYTLRPEATWDDGTPITGYDVAFTYKVIAHPDIPADHLKPYLSSITHIEVDADHPKQFTLTCQPVQMRAEISTGAEAFILPKHVYDPEGWLDDIRYNATLTGPEEKLSAFADYFTHIRFARQPDSIIGSGAYKIARWETGQRVVVTRKDNWWGDAVEAKQNEYFEAYPTTITHEIISDQSAAITALKGGQLDVMRSVRAKDYREDLMENERVNDQFNLHQPPQFSYSCFGIHQQHRFLNDKLTRQALAYLVPYQRMREDILYGFGEPITGPVLPFIAQWYNDTLQPYTYQPEKAAALLRQAGWVDRDQDGLLEKQIDGEWVPFSFSFLYNAGNRDREKVALMYQNALEKAGIQMDITPFEWSIYLDKIMSHDFDMFYVVLSTDPGLEDFSQLWHTASANGGSNFVEFGDASTDALIDSINTTLDEAQRADLVRQFQAILHDEVPYIFLWTPENRIAIHNRLENGHLSAYRPGFWTPGLRLANANE